MHDPRVLSPPALQPYLVERSPPPEQVHRIVNQEVVAKVVG